MWIAIIKEIKQATGLTQPEIANECGCSQTTISELETGKTGDPRYRLGTTLLNLHRKHCDQKNLEVSVQDTKPTSKTHKPRSSRQAR